MFHMDDKETLHRRARLRELIWAHFGDPSEGGQAALREHIKNHKGVKVNQGELSGLLKDHNAARSFGDKKARALADQIGLHRRWFDFPMGVNISRGDWLKDAPVSLLDSSISGNIPSHSLNTEAWQVFDGHVPLITWEQAGMLEDVVSSFSESEGEWVESVARKTESPAYALRVVGDTMEPRFPEGTILIIEPCSEAEHGKFVIARQKGSTDAVFKELIKDGANWYLKPLNPRYPILPLDKDTVICGKLRRAVQEYS